MAWIYRKYTKEELKIVKNKLELLLKIKANNKIWHIIITSNQTAQKKHIITHSIHINKKSKIKTIPLLMIQVKYIVITVIDDIEALSFNF